LIAWLVADGDTWLRRAGVGYIIFERRIYTAWEPRGWRPYTGKDPHTTHVHLSFSERGAIGETSAYALHLFDAGGRVT
jgi:hypothetical protein